MELSTNVKGLIIKLSLIVITCIIILWVSVFAYGLLYYTYIPAVAHVKPVYLNFDTTCIKGSICKHPYDNITLVEKGHYELLRRGQIYALELILDMPESERNLNQGMFMVRLDVLAQDGHIVKSSRRPALLHYKSPLFKILYTLFYMPCLLIGSTEEKQIVTVSLFEQYMEDNYYPGHFAYIEIEAQSVEVYSAKLRIHAQFTGLRYVMYYWPLTSAVIGVAFNFCILALTVIFIWIRQIMTTSAILNNYDLSLKEEQQLKKEIRRAMKKRMMQKSDKKTLDNRKVQIEEIEVEDLPSYRDKKEPDIRKNPREKLEAKDMQKPKDKTVPAPGKCQRQESEAESLTCFMDDLTPVTHIEQSSDDWVDVSNSERFEDCVSEDLPTALHEVEEISCEIHHDPNLEEIEEPISREQFSPTLRKRVLH